MTRFRLLAVAAGLAILLALPAAAAADLEPRGLFRAAAPAAEDDIGARVAALGAPLAQRSYRRAPAASGPYRPTYEPTRDQTSPFGVEILVGFMDRDVDRSDFPFEFDVESTRLLAKVTFRPASFFEVYGLGGIADVDSPFEDADFDGDFGGALGGGARITFYRDPQWYDTTVFLEGRYLQYESEASGVQFETVPGDCAVGGPTCVSADQSFDWREWEGRMGVSWRFYLTRPYLGIRYSDAEADSRISISPAEFDLRARDNVGGFLGIDVYFDPERRIGLNLDVSFPDQTTFQAGLKFWF